MFSNLQGSTKTLFTWNDMNEVRRLLLCGLKKVVDNAKMTVISGESFIVLSLRSFMN